jgi:hypothetical protein
LTRPIDRLVFRNIARGISTKGGITEIEMNYAMEMISTQFSHRIELLDLCLVDERTAGKLMPNDKLLTAPGRNRIDVPPAELVKQEISCLLFAASFWASGRYILRPTANLIGMLRDTDPTGIHINDLKLPGKCIYVSFAEAPLSGFPGKPNIIDGCYIIDNGNCWQLVVTSARQDIPGNKAARWPLSRDRYQTRFLDESTFDLDLATALGVALEDESNAYGQNAAEIKEQLASLSNSDEADAMDISDMMEKGQITEKASVRLPDRVEELRATNAQIKIAVNLALNCLAYATAEPEDLMTVYPVDTPPAWIAAGNNRKGREKFAKDLLENLYLSCKQIGGNLRPRTMKTVDGQSTAAAHHRRGHWRRQAHGPALASRKIIWVKPTFVHGNHETNDTIHVHQIDV